MSPRSTCPLGRRGMLAAVATVLAGFLAGCSSDPSFSDADVIAGPGGDPVFDPAELTVSVGTTVTWGFASAGHNVSCRPDNNERVALPDEADPFASYGAEESPEGSVVPRNETYEHTFDVEGEYVYVCIPHVSQGMVGTIHVE
ncbi:MAG: plastocyanin/azurin family copper-binding protein [Halapricum sp.]